MIYQNLHFGHHWVPNGPKVAQKEHLENTHKLMLQKISKKCENDLQNELQNDTFFDTFAGLGPLWAPGGQKDTKSDTFKGPGLQITPTNSKNT